MSALPFGEILLLGSGQASWMTGASVTGGAGQYVLREDPLNDQYVIQKIDSGNLGTAVNLTHAQVNSLWDTYPDEMGGYVQYFVVPNGNAASLAPGDYAFFNAPITVYAGTGALASTFSSHANATAFMGVFSVEEGMTKEGSYGVSNIPVVYLSHDDIHELDGDGSSISEGYYIINVTSGQVTSINKVDNTGTPESPAFGNAGTAISSFASMTGAEAYSHIFGSNFVIDLGSSVPTSPLTSGTVQKMDFGWDVLEANSSELQMNGTDPAVVMGPAAIPLTLTNVGTASDIQGTPIVTGTYDPTAAPDSLVAQNGIFIGPQSSGDFYTFSNDTTYSTTALNGDYVIVNYDTDHYTAYELNGNGDMDDPYEIADDGLHLDLMDDSDWTTLYDGGNGKDGSYDMTADEHNVYDIPAAWTDGTSTSQAMGKYVFYEKFTAGVSDGIYAKKMKDDGSALDAGAVEIDVGSWSAFEALVAALDSSAYFDASGGGVVGGGGTGVVGGGDGVAVTSWHDSSSLTLDLDTEIYALESTVGGVSADGLYVLKLNAGDSTSYDAHLVTGNQQVGYNVAETADKVSLYATAQAVTDASLNHVGALDTRIVNITAGDSITGDNGPLDGDYALILNGSTSKFDAYEVTTQQNGNFILGDKAKSSIFENATAVNASSLATVGYLDDAAATDYVGTADQAIFEIEQVTGGRYGNIITYGVKLIDGNYGENATLTSAMINLSWTSLGGDADYSYWGQFTPTNGSPSTLTLESVPAGGSETPATFFTTVGDTGISFGMFDDSGMTYEAGEYIATFMLEKTNSLTSNDLTLTTAQYTLYDAYDTQTNVTPEEQASTTDSFSFAAHDMTLKLKNANGEEIPGVELMVTDLSTNDGLSIVPVLRNGDIIQYQLVMNVPIPTFIEDSPINPYHKIDITGADIFDSSITWLTSLADGTTETGSLIRNVTSKTVSLDDTVTAVSDASATHTGHEFLDLVLSTNDIETDLSTSDKLTFELSNLLLPELMAGVTAVNAEGRYILAEFSAHADNTIKFTASQKADSGDSWAASAERTISRDADGVYGAADATAQESDAAGGWIQSGAIADGSEVVALAEGWYMNERESNDAVGASTLR